MAKNIEINDHVLEGELITTTVAAVFIHRHSFTTGVHRPRTLYHYFPFDC